MSETTELNYLWPYGDLAASIERARAHPVEGTWRLHALLRGPHDVHLGGFSADGTRDEMIEKALSLEPTDEDMRLEYREGLRLAADAEVIFQVTVMPKPPWKSDVAKRRFVLQSRGIDAAGYVHSPKAVMVDDGDGSIGFDLTIPEEATDEEVAAAMGDALRKLLEQTKA